MSVASAITNVILRAFVGSFVAGAAVVVALVGGALGGGGRTAMFLATFVVLFCAGWALLPAIRESRLLSVLVALGWAYVGYRCWQFGAEHVRGWMLFPWILATCAVLVCLVFGPPEYVLNAVNPLRDKDEHGDASLLPTDRGEK
jgi:hypothetical protein